MAELRVAGQQPPVGRDDGEVLLLGPIEKNVLDFARRQVEDRLAIAQADVGGDGVGVVSCAWSKARPANIQAR